MKEKGNKNLFVSTVSESVLSTVSSTTVNKYWRGSRELSKSMQFAYFTAIIDDIILLTVSIYLVRSTTIQNINNC